MICKPSFHLHFSLPFSKHARIACSRDLGTVSKPRFSLCLFKSSATVEIIVLLES